MKRVFYAGGAFVTGDRTAQAVLDYAQALAEREASAAIDIPVYGPGGMRGRAQLLVGPASQLMVVSEVSDAVEVDDEATLDHLARQIEGLLRPNSRPIEVTDVVVGDAGSDPDSPSGFSLR